MVRSVNFVLRKSYDPYANDPHSIEFFEKIQLKLPRDLLPHSSKCQMSNIKYSTVKFFLLGIKKLKNLFPVNFII